MRAPAAAPPRSCIPGQEPAGPRQRSGGQASTLASDGAGEARASLRGVTPELGGGQAGTASADRAAQHDVGHLGRRRPAEQVPLPLIAAEAAQLGELLRRLDALGDDLQPERAGEADDGADDGGVPAVRGQAGDERAVDLQHVDREALAGSPGSSSRSRSRRWPAGCRVDFRCSSVLTVASASPIAVPSVISTSSPTASSPDSASTWPTSCDQPRVGGTGAARG